MAVLSHWWLMLPETLKLVGVDVGAAGKFTAVGITVAEPAVPDDAAACSRR